MTVSWFWAYYINNTESNAPLVHLIDIIIIHFQESQIFQYLSCIWTTNSRANRTNNIPRNNYDTMKCLSNPSQQMSMVLGGQTKIEFDGMSEWNVPGMSKVTMLSPLCTPKVCMYAPYYCQFQLRDVDQALYCTIMVSIPLQMQTCKFPVKNYKFSELKKFSFNWNSANSWWTY
jgi:hypothetical protein